jgi:hypothetical protein
MQPADSKGGAITVVDANSNMVTIKFSEEELEKIKEDASLLMKKLKSKGVKCCEKRERISSCIWRCCDGKLIKTCGNQVLNDAFKKIVKDFDIDDGVKTSVHKERDET